MNQFTVLKTLLEKYHIVIFVAAILSLLSFAFYYFNGNLNLAFGDALSRLDISRKIIDNLNPGLGQIGSVWLPLQFLLMLPFIGNNFLWHSGIAGYIVSGVSFVLTIYFLYKLGQLAFNSRIAGLLMAVFAMTCINLLYVQTTAMSEPLYIMTITGATYFFYKWAKFGTIQSLVMSAVFIAAATFTRYEGYLVFLLSLVLIFVISKIKSQSRTKIEGALFLFATLASTGIVAWCLYNWVIFGNPFYWKDIYLGQANIISTESAVKSVHDVHLAQGFDLQRLADAFAAYWTAILETNGLFISIYAFLGLIFFAIWSFWKRRFMHEPQILSLLLPVGSFLFVIFSIYNGFPLSIPPLSLSNILSKNTNYLGQYNLIYGLVMLPLVAFMVGFLSSRNRVLLCVTVIVLILQFVSAFWGPVFSVYQFTRNFQGPNSLADNGQNSASSWLKKNYSGGEILISAQDHNPDMFYLGVDFKKYIHEGAGKYWMESRINPQKYASWIYMYAPAYSKDDTVTKYMTANPNLNTYFNLVYNNGTYQVYKIKTKPEVQIGN